MKKIIILGAGASCDFGFETGIGFMKAIYSRWNNPNDLYVRFYSRVLKEIRKIQSEPPNKELVEKIKKLAYRLYFSGAPSIDDFLAHTKDKVDVNFGKLTILSLIREMENIARNNGLFRWEDNWLRIFFRKEFCYEEPKILEDKLENNPVIFITFNYDRSLEFFIFNALKNYYDLQDNDEVKQLFKKITFYHIYGRLAPLEWQVTQRDEFLSFGYDVAEKPTIEFISKLYQHSQNIKIINETGMDFENTVKDCKGFIKEADKVFILGFGFLTFNFKLLGIEEYRLELQDKKVPEGKFIYTTFGLSHGDEIEIINKFVTAPGGKRIKSYKENIYDFMNHYY